MRSKLFYYPGSKSRVIKELIDYFPKNYTKLSWLDAFGGSGVVTYNKQPSLIEVFNDLDEGISAIFYCLLFKFEEFAFRLNLAQSSESILKWINDKTIVDSDDSIVDKAIKKIYLMQFSYSSKGESLSFYKTPGTSRRSNLKLFELNLFNNWRNNA